jgi:hypothetical protein
MLVDTGLRTLLSVSYELVPTLALTRSRVKMVHLLQLKCAHSPLNQCIIALLRNIAALHVTDRLTCPTPLLDTQEQYTNA